MQTDVYLFIFFTKFYYLLVCLVHTDHTTFNFLYLHSTVYERENSQNGATKIFTSIFTKLQTVRRNPLT
jgi:hypothetical protein